MCLLLKVVTVVVVVVVYYTNEIRTNKRAIMKFIVIAFQLCFRACKPGCFEIKWYTSAAGLC